MTAENDPFVSITITCGRVASTQVIDKILELRGKEETFVQSVYSGHKVNMVIGLRSSQFDQIRDWLDRNNTNYFRA